MKKIATLIITAAFAAPALVHANDFGIGIEDGYRFHQPGYGQVVASSAITIPPLVDPDVVNFGVEVESGYDPDHAVSPRLRGILLSDTSAPSNRDVLDFGIGIDAGY